MSFSTATEKEILKLLVLGKLPIGGTPASRNTDIVGADRLFLGVHIEFDLDEASNDVPDVNEPTNEINLQAFLGEANAQDADNGYHRVPLDNSLSAGSGEVEMFSEASIDAHVEGPILNTSVIQFSQALSPWGSIFDWFITDTADLTLKGNIRATGKLKFHLDVKQFDVPTFQIGALSLTVK